MRVAYFDCPSGAAGDMILGALVDAGAPFEKLRLGLERLRLSGYSLDRREVMKGPFRATKVEVRVERGERPAPDARGAGALPRSGGVTHHAHRDLAAVLDIIGKSDLAGAVKDNASRIFRRLAEAEGRAHGTAPERVVFHDVGAVDAIVDVVGSCIGLELLDVKEVHCSPLPIGGGIVRGPHGPMPVPAPGTAELLKGFPVVDTGVKRELVTPTGAAILTTLAVASDPMPTMTVAAIGYGAGTMDLDTPNVLRVFVGETAGEPGTETILQLETTVDDMSPQLYEPLMERLFGAGALDVYLTPVLMKKSRPGVVVTALCPPSAVNDLARACFQESTTIGVRWTTYRRERLARELVTLETSLGALTFKVSRHEGRAVTVTPEFDEVKRLAREQGVTVREALDRARAEGRRLVT